MTDLSLSVCVCVCMCGTVCCCRILRLKFSHAYILLLLFAVVFVTSVLTTKRFFLFCFFLFILSLYFIRDLKEEEKQPGDSYFENKMKKKPKTNKGTQNPQQKPVSQFYYS